MIDRRCIICGKSVPKHKRLYCSQECAKEGERRKDRARGGQKIHPAPYRWITCPDCGNDVYVHVKSIRCPQCQRVADNRHDAQHRKRKSAGHARQIGSIALCEHCGKEYIVSGGRQKYCPVCAPTAIAKNVKATAVLWNREHYASPDAKKARNERRHAIRPYELTCAICGKPFVADDPRRLCCSQECEKHRKKVYGAEYYKRKHSSEK